ncbi:MAG: DUF1800 domain-containing protein [Planctomycetes bacterium]|nr:DUF1800 domain-containing protein [Planctomycetota bacterium]
MPQNQQPIDPRWAWDRYRPSDAAPWDLKKAGHLFRRAAFGATSAELQAAVREGPERSVTALLQGRADAQGDELWTTMSRSLADANVGDQLSALWLYRMLYSAHPLREKLTLFWHNHFATSNIKVRNVGYMLGQYELMRRHAQGNFRTLLTEMSRDPAMMVWLDTIQSQRNQPNENYARELMELFSLGVTNARRPGQRNYTEDDIRQAARAFTGLRIVDGRGVFRESDHDGSEKNVLGQRGRWRPDDVVRICLEQESAPYFIARKLFRFLVSDSLDATPALLEPLATEFRRNYDFGALVERVLRSNLFFSAHAYRTKIKAPVDFVLGIARGLEAHRAAGAGQGGLGTVELARVLEGLGQRLFYPPSVAGWEGGRAWLNGQTFLLRQNLALALTSTTDVRFGRRLDPAALLRRHNANTNAQRVDFLLRVFLQGDVPAASRTRLLDYAASAERQAYPVYWTADDAANHRMRTLGHLVLCLPECQLD